MKSASRPVCAAADAVMVRAGVHSNGMIGGIGLRATDLEALQAIAAESDGESTLLQAVRGLADAALAQAGISYGVDAEALETAVAEFVASVRAGEPRVVTHKIAAGEAADPGEGPRIEYPLNHLGRPFHELVGLDETSQRCRRTVVNRDDVLAILRPGQAPKKGTNVRGEAVEPPAQDAEALVSLELVAGENTQVSGGNLLAACDGICEEDARGNLRVVPQIDVERIDEATGRVPETGISHAHVRVTKSIRGAAVATTETVFVGVGPEGGGVEGHCAVHAGHLVVAGRIMGDSSGHVPPVEADDLLVAQEVVNRPVSAGRLFVARDCQFARVECDQEAHIDGNLRGGMVACRALLQVAGDVGSEGEGSHTRIAMPENPPGERRKRKLTAAAVRYRDQLAALQAQAEEADKRGERRSKADSYWAALMQGERVHPKTPMQVKALQQFVEYVAEKRDIGRRIKGVKQALMQLAAQAKELEKAAAAETAVMVQVAGTIHLDVQFEVLREVERGDDEVPVRFEHDGNEYMRSTLAKARGVLARQVREYCEQHHAWVEEKRAALDKMFEGQDKRPAAPEVQDRTFELEVTLLELESPAEFDIHAVLVVHAKEPRRVRLRTMARLRQPLRNVTVTMSRTGCRGAFGVVANRERALPWRTDKGVLEQLEALVVGSDNAAELAARMG